VKKEKDCPLGKVIPVQKNVEAKRQRATPASLGDFGGKDKGTNREEAWKPIKLLRRTQGEERNQNAKYETDPRLINRSWGGNVKGFGGGARPQKRGEKEIEGNMCWIRGQS